MKGLKKILLMLMLALPLAAAGVYLFKTLDIKDGLTSSQINCILKDSRGYMWLGTPAGLYRYDGYTSIAMTAILSGISRAIRKTVPLYPTAISRAFRSHWMATCGFRRQQAIVSITLRQRPSSAT